MCRFVGSAWLNGFEYDLRVQGHISFFLDFDTDFVFWLGFCPLTFFILGFRFFCLDFDFWFVWGSVPLHIYLYISVDLFVD